MTTAQICSFSHFPQSNLDPKKKHLEYIHNVEWNMESFRASGSKLMKIFQLDRRWETIFRVMLVVMKIFESCQILIVFDDSRCILKLPNRALTCPKQLVTG